MHVAFGRVRRKSRIDADYTDFADFGIFAVFKGFGKLRVCSWVSTSFQFNLRAKLTHKCGWETASTGLQTARIMPLIRLIWLTPTLPKDLQRELVYLVLRILT